MSYDIVVTAAPLPREDAEAWEGVDALLERHGPIVNRMEAFYGELEALYPSVDTVSDEEWEENSPWSDGSLRGYFDADWAYMGLRWSAADRAVPVVVDLAHRHDLAVLDLAVKQIHRGDGHRGFWLDVEGGAYLIAPREDQIRHAVASLSPDGAGAFLLVSAPGDDYAQVAGGLGEYVFERRDHADGAFRHWAAARRGGPTSGRHRVQMRGAHVEVRPNEVLSAEEACRLLMEFVRGQSLSPDFAWRDMTIELPQS